MPTREVRATARRAAPVAAPAVPAAAADRLVIGSVPPVARAAGVLLVLSGLTGVAALPPTYLVVGGSRLVLGGGALDLLLGLLPALVAVPLGAALAAGRAPKLGLAYAAVGGVLAVGQLLIELHLGRGSTDRPGVEVLAGELVVTSSVRAGAGWWLTVASLGLLVAAGAVALAAWSRTVMEDSGALDPARPGLTAAAVFLGVATVLSLTLPAADVPDDLVTDPVTGLQTVVPREGPQGLLERPLLALLGGLLLAGAVVLCSVVAPSLRPRLGAVGGLLALTTVVLDAGLTGVRDAAAPDLQWTVPGGALVVAGLGYAVLALLAWRLGRRSTPRE